MIHKTECVRQRTEMTIDWVYFPKHGRWRSSGKTFDANELASSACEPLNQSNRCLICSIRSIYSHCYWFDNLEIYFIQMRRLEQLNKLMLAYRGERGSGLQELS